ncbi:hypothetical protein MCEMKE45_01357 [Candidatus Planktophila vernalis]|uniref:FkbM family methyltransferase n=1 Tax=Candidatus Planktophila vernalis TaxID=1884907 RepID=UPI003CEC6C68
MKSMKQSVGECFPRLADFLLNCNFLLLPDKSQFGESKVLSELVVSHKLENYLEIGCSNPVAWSNSYSLRKFGLNGISIDANLDLSLQWKIFRPKDTFIQVGVVPFGTKNELKFYKFPRRHSVLNTFSQTEARKWSRGLGFKPTEIVVQQLLISDLFLIAEAKFGHVDLLLLDIEGFDVKIIPDVLNLKQPPRIILVEDKNFEVTKVLEGTRYRCLKSFNGQSVFELTN